MRITQCEIGTVGLVDKNTLLIDIESEQEIRVEHVFEFQSAVAELVGSKKMYSIINYGAYSLPTKQARDLCSHENSGSHILGRALVVNDMGQMIIARHSLKYKTIPTKIFSDLESAKKWVKEINQKALV